MRAETAGRPERRERIRESLRGFADGLLEDRARDLLEELGYSSSRHVEIGPEPEDLIDEFETPEGRPIAKRQRELILETWKRVAMVFQYTDEEIGEQGSFFAGQEWDDSRAKSFLFLAVDLRGKDYSRSDLAAMTRAVNRPFAMPVIVFFRYHRATGRTALTLAVVHRRAHKRDATKDVLDRATFVKDIDTSQPHRAHIDLLSELALDRLGAVKSFDQLHGAWEAVLNIEKLGRRFYRKLFEWFERAVGECSFPDDGGGAGSNERHVIRMITRLLFIWFLREKRLVPGDLFRESFARSTVTNHDPASTAYYRAVLQNLFFATLNTPIRKRNFSSVDRSTHRDFTKYRYRDLLADPGVFVARLAEVPFVNGGLFDCLDTFEHTGGGGRRVDVFTDNREHRKALRVPAHLFLHEEHGLFPLFDRYKFTVEENTPLDREVALDPELLGKAFENLLAAYNPETREHARKATGSYYTPRAVVDYMVDEALAAHFARAVAPYDADDDWLDQRLRHLLAIDQGEGAFGRADRSEKSKAPVAVDHRNDNDDHLIDESEMGPLIDAIHDLTVLDPACGSGAFPMGVLQKLVMVLGTLDPKNDRWKARQIAVAQKIADPAARRRAVKAVEEAFSPERGFGDYGRKLYLIQSVIHGIDVQPIATQIAKLRFFISLIIEQIPNDSAEANYGIEPLPNLETCFVAADTLRSLRRPGQRSLIATEVERIEGELEALRAQWFDARDRDEKWEIRKRDKSLRKELAKALIENEWDAAEAQAVANWDIYDQNGRADWFDPEWMFGDRRRVFDIVIGNPPYIQLQKNRGELANRYRDEEYGTFVRTGDVYVLFCERGMALIRAGRGVLSYVTSNSWLRAKYGQGLRRLLSDSHTPLRLIELGKDVFENAIVDSSVLIARSGGRAGPFPALDVDRLKSDTVDLDDLADEEWDQVRPGGDAPWSILSRPEWRVMEKMKERGTPLKDWDGISIYYGIKTGYNPAFIVDDATRNRLVAEDARSAEILKPILRGRDIRRYRADWAGLWLIATHNGYDDVPAVRIEEYPAVRRHLDRFYPKLEKRYDKGRTG